MLGKEEHVFLAQSYFNTAVVAVLSIAILVLVPKICWRLRSKNVGGIPGHLGLPFVGETISFLSANNSTKGCYNFVSLRRSWLVVLSPIMMIMDILYTSTVVSRLQIFLNYDSDSPHSRSSLDHFSKNIKLYILDGFFTV